MIYGIDLGTTNTLVSLFDPQTKSSVILSGLIPSVVNFLSGDVGEKSKNNLNKNIDSDNILSSFKVDITTDVIGEPSINASAMVLNECKKYMKYGGNEVVISVPAYFLNKQREATKLAAAKAGLEVVSLINEPTAAALYYSKELKDKSVIYDLGGGTFDTTVIDTQYGMSDIQATEGNKIGGDNLNEAIYSQLCNECKVKLHKLSEGAYKAIIEECEKLKIKIQKERRTVIFNFSNSFYKDAFEKTIFELTEEKYRNIVKSTFGSTLRILKDVIKKSGYLINDLKLILVGGSTRDPYLVEMIKKIKKPEAVNYNPDEIVAQPTF